MKKNEKKTNDIKEFEKNQAIFVEVVAKPTTFVPRWRRRRRRRSGWHFDSDEILPMFFHWRTAQSLRLVPDIKKVQQCRAFDENWILTEMSPHTHSHPLIDRKFIKIKTFYRELIISYVAWKKLSWRLLSLPFLTDLSSMFYLAHPPTRKVFSFQIHQVENWEINSPETFYTPSNPPAQDISII